MRNVLHKSDIVPLNDAIKVYVTKCLNICDGNVKRTSELLGVQRNTVYRIAKGKFIPKSKGINKSMYNDK